MLVDDHGLVIVTQVRTARVARPSGGNSEYLIGPRTDWSLQSAPGDELHAKASLSHHSKFFVSQSIAAPKPLLVRLRPRGTISATNSSWGGPSCLITPILDETDEPTRFY
jgi:hypothetical protein